MDAETYHYLRKFCELYDAAVETSSVHKLKPLKNNEEWEAFRTVKGLPPAIVSVKEHHRHVPAYSPFYRFYNANKLFWIIPCGVPGGIAGFVLRAFKVTDPKQKFVHFAVKDGPDLLYGWEDFHDFRPDRDPVILTEGIKDALFLKQFHPYTLACLTSSVSEFTLKILSRMTRNVVLAFDMDKAGRSGVKKVREGLTNAKVVWTALMPPYANTDWGGYWGGMFRNAFYMDETRAYVEKTLGNLKIPEERGA